MSTSGQALTAARTIQEAMRDYGVNCIIQLRQGASRSGWLTPMSTRAGVMSHHIVSARTHGTTPFYNLVRNGRPGIPGPLANGYGGWDKVYRIITMGWANHPGAGGPITLAGRRIPRDNGRPYFWGTEYEGGLRASDWQQDDYHGWMATCNAALLDAFNLPTSAHLEHLTWAPGRKIDRLHYTTASGRARIADVLNRSKTDPRRDWFDMADKDDLRDVLREQLTVRLTSSQQAALVTGREVWALSDLIGILAHRIGYNFQRSATIRDNVAAAAGERAGLLEAIRQVAGGAAIDLDAIQRAAEKGVSDALDSLEADVTLTINTDQEEG